MTEKQYAESLGRFIKHERELRGMTQTQLAEKMGVTKMMVSHWERGSRNLFAYQVGRMCKIFGMSQSEFYSKW